MNPFSQLSKDQLLVIWQALLQFADNTEEEDCTPREKLEAEIAQELVSLIDEEIASSAR
jgi:hypothetical protein